MSGKDNMDKQYTYTELLKTADSFIKKIDNFIGKAINFAKSHNPYLEEKKISRRQFCALVDIPTSTIASWKAKNVLPSIELVAKLARFMNVSLDWLVYGENPETTLSENTDENPYSRKSILYRIETVLRQNNDDYELKSLHEKYLSDIIEYEALMNWVNGKSYISEEVLPKIAKN